jgi:lysophospholipase L1-like esterase
VSHRKRSAFVLAMTATVALLLGTGALSSARADAPPGGQLFSWSAPAHFGSERDELGRIVETQPEQVRKGPFPIDLQVTGPACRAGARYEWRIGREAIGPRRTGICRFRWNFPREGDYRMTLVARTRGARLTATETVRVRDLLIVSIGDSVASGEAVPDIPGAGHATWQSARCHRSALAAPAQAARMIEADDSHSSVTFVHLACSGATVPAGLVGPYKGVENPDGEPPLEAQVRILNRIAAVRPVDAVLLSIGANDVHFGEVVRFCVRKSDCFSQPFPQAGDPPAGEVVAAAVADLPNRYRAVADQLSKRIAPASVHIVEYFDAIRDENGEVCDGILVGVSAAELREAGTRMLEPLNRAVDGAARAHHWDEVKGVAPAFRRHGYCAADQAWVTTLGDSVASLGGRILGRFLGTLHPNLAGHRATANRIAASLERDLYPGRSFAPRRDPTGRDEEGRDEEDGGGTSASTLVLSALGALILSVALPLGLLLAAAATPPAAIAFGLARLLPWLWEEAQLAVLIAAGIAIALLILARPFWRADDDPFRRVGNTVRPLTLPLFVVVAIGAIRFGVLGVVLVSAVATLLAWRLVICPAAAESDLPLEWEWRRLLRTFAKHAGVVVAIAVAVWLVAVPIVNNTAYFETIDSFTSALVLLAILLWFAAVGLRLLSYADSRLRAAIAAVAGLALVRLAIALGVLPGEPDRGGGIPATVEILGAILLALLLVEVLLAALPDRAGRGLRGALLKLRQGGVPGQPAERSKALGFAAAVAAAGALLVSTGWGLVEQAERGEPLRPPEDASLEAGRPVPQPVEVRGRGGLVREYAPVLAFTAGERWTPIAVDSYLQNARLIGPGGDADGPRGVAAADLEKQCPAGQRNCYTLTIDCESGDEECAHGEVRDRDQERLYREGAVYTRVIRKAKRPALFSERGPFAGSLETLIQYWYFYYYDEWRAPVFAGLLTQKHEGDWEVVSVGLDAGRKPLFVAESAHCGGTWRYWDEVETSKLLPAPYVHPLVAVAEGSHANYPDPDQKRTSDPAACAHAPAGVATAITYASNIRDRTEYGWAWYPPRGGWLRAEAGKAPMSFKGAWGASDRTILTNFNSHQIGVDGHGPYSPPLQSSWTRPTATIFCESYKPPPARPGRPIPGCAGD